MPVWAQLKKEMSDIHDTINYKGYAIQIMNDECAEDPYDRDDSMPPALTYYLRNRRMDSKRDFYWCDISMLLEKKHVRSRSQRENLADIWNVSYDGMLCDSKDYSGKDTADRFLDLLRCTSRERCTYWGEVIAYFDALENLCKIVGVPCLNKQSNGHNQGDSTLVFMAATPDYMKEFGIPHKHVDSSLLASYKEYSAWCWGDVYVCDIKQIMLDDEGEEDDLEDTNESCGGFYGSDHKESGLLEYAQNAIDCLIVREAKEHVLIHEAACRDILTVR